MKLLLDICAFLWLSGQPDRLSPSAAQAIGGGLQVVTSDRAFDDLGVSRLW